jgi:hypothetical protein
VPDRQGETVRPMARPNRTRSRTGPVGRNSPANGAPQPDTLAHRTVSLPIVGRAHNPGSHILSLTLEDVYRPTYLHAARGCVSPCLPACRSRMCIVYRFNAVDSGPLTLDQQKRASLRERKRDSLVTKCHSIPINRFIRSSFRTRYAIGYFTAGFIRSLSCRPATPRDTLMNTTSFMSVAEIWVPNQGTISKFRSIRLAWGFNSGNYSCRNYNDP